GGAVGGVGVGGGGGGLVWACYGGRVAVWEVAAGARLQPFTGHVGPAFCAAFTPDGRRVASGGWDRTLKIWDPTTGQEVLSLRGHEELVWRVVFSSDGRMATGSADNTVVL